MVAVGEVGGNEEFPFAADGHHLEGFGPTGDHAIDSEFDRMVLFDGAFEDASIDQGTMVVDLHHVGEFGFGTGTFLHDGILEAAGQNDDARFGFVGGEELITEFAGCSGFVCFGSLHVVDDTGVCLLFVEEQFTFFIDVVDRTGYERRIDIGDVLLFVEVGNAETDGIAERVLL